MNRLILSAASLSLLCGLVSPTYALTQKQRQHIARVDNSRSLTVTGRSWLDSGNVVPVGTGQSYLAAAESLNTQTYTSYAPDRFGQSTLPGRFDLPFANNPRGNQSGGIFFDD